MLTHVDWSIRPQGKHGANLTVRVSQGTKPSLAPVTVRTGFPYDQAQVLGVDHRAGQSINKMQWGTFRGNMRHGANFVDVDTT